LPIGRRAPLPSATLALPHGGNRLMTLTGNRQGGLSNTSFIS
jgi:hypothetical protein